MLEEICERIKYLEIKNLESEKRIKDMEEQLLQVSGKVRNLRSANILYK